MKKKVDKVNEKSGKPATDCYAAELCIPLISKIIYFELAWPWVYAI